MQVQEVMHDNAALKRRIEAMEADVQRRCDTDRDKFSVRVSSNMTLGYSCHALNVERYQ